MRATADQSLHRIVWFVGGSTLLQPVLALGISVIIARTLGPEGRGAYGVMVTTAAILPAVTSLGLEYAVRFWSAEGRADPHALLKLTTLASLAVGGAAAAIVVASWWARWPDWLVPLSLGRVGIASLGLVVLLSSVRGFWFNYLAGKERYGFGTWGTTGAMALQLVAIASAWHLHQISLDVAMMAYALQLSFSIVLFFRLAGRDLVRALTAPWLALTELTRMFSYGRWQYLTILLLQTNMRLNIFMLAALSSLHETGLYTAVLGPASFLAMVGAPLNLVLSARTTRRSDDPAFPGRVAAALRLIFLVTAGLACAAAVVAPVLLPLVFGERFRPAVAPFRILLPGIVAFGLVGVITQYLAGANRPQWNTVLSATGAFFAVVLNLALIPRYGARGAAFATSLAYLISLAVALVAFVRTGRIRFRELLTFRGSDWIPLGRVIGITPHERATS